MFKIVLTDSVHTGRLLSPSAYARVEYSYDYYEIQIPSVTMYLHV